MRSFILLSATAIGGSVFGQAIGGSDRLDPPVIQASHEDVIDQSSGERLGNLHSGIVPSPSILPQGGEFIGGRMPHTLIGRPPTSAVASRYVDPVFAPASGRGEIEPANDPAWSSDPAEVEKRALSKKVRGVTHPGGQPRFLVAAGRHALETEWRQERGNLRSADVQHAWKTPYSYGYFGAESRRHWTNHQGYRDRSTQWRFQ